MTRRFLSVIAFVCTAVALTAASASAQWRPVVRQCVAGDPATGCAHIAQFGGAWNVVISPDGKTAYAAAFSSGAVHVFDRNTATGVLIHKSCLTWFPNVPGCTSAVPAIRRPDEIMVAANGKDVYVTSEADAGQGVAASIVTFTRDPATGLLTFASCINENATEGCTDGTAVGGRGAILTPDQKHVYTLGTQSVRAFKRDASGTLSEVTPMGCYGPDAGCIDLPGNEPGGRQLAPSSDGTRLYVPSFAGAVLVFGRDLTSGAIAPLAGKAGCYSTAGSMTCTAVPQIGHFTENVVLSPGGKHVYLSHGNGIVTFARNAGDGTLAFANCINDTGTLGCATSSNVSLLKYMAVSPDGEDLLAVPQTSPGGFTAFARNAANGALTRRPGPDGCVTPDGSGGCRASTAVNFFGQIRFAGNEMIYGGFLGGSRISLFKRDFYPLCRSGAVTANRNAAVAIPLPCSDRNGDAIIRAIVTAPTAGTLGAINQAAASVFYNPFRRFAGTDHFTFRGVAAGLAGPPASIAVTVPAGPKPKPKRIRGVTLAYGFAAFTDHTVLTKLAVKGVPRRSTVRVVCKCGRKPRTFKKKRARGTLDLKRFVHVSLPVGSRLTVTVTKARMIGAAKLMTIRHRAAPKVTTRCLRPGSKKLRKRC